MALKLVFVRNTKCDLPECSHRTSDWEGDLWFSVERGTIEGSWLFCSQACLLDFFTGSIGGK